MAVNDDKTIIRRPVPRGRGGGGPTITRGPREPSPGGGRDHHPDDDLHHHRPQPRQHTSPPPPPPRRETEPPRHHANPHAEDRGVQHRAEGRESVPSAPPHGEQAIHRAPSSERDAYEVRDNKVRNAFIDRVKAGGLLHLASESLLVGFELSNQHHDPGVQQLRGTLQELVATFLQSGRANNISKDLLDRAGYVICAYLDEQVMATAWGANSDWGIHPLLVEFYRDALGGERFFEILEDAKRRSGENIELLELQYYCLAFGFEGDYKIGKLAELEGIKNDLYAQLRRYRKDPVPELSTNWEGQQGVARGLGMRIPGWVFLAFASIILLAMYQFFRWHIGGVQTNLYQEQVTKVSASPIRVAAVDKNPWRDFGRIEEGEDVATFIPPVVVAPEPVVIVPKPPVDNIFITFTIRGSALNADYRHQLEEFYHALQSHQRQYAERISTFVLTVTGRASPPGPTEYNRRLSRDRAHAVANFLREIDHSGILEFMEVEGIGTDDLLNPPDGQDFNQFNQSVQVYVAYQR